MEYISNIFFSNTDFGIDFIKMFLSPLPRFQWAIFPVVHDWFTIVFTFLYRFSWKTLKAWPSVVFSIVSDKKWASSIACAPPCPVLGVVACPASPIKQILSLYQFLRGTRSLMSFLSIFSSFVFSNNCFTNGWNDL